MRRASILGLAFLALASSSPAQTLQPYEIVTETDMPHLEENLRYAVRRESRCLDRHDLSAAFWMLGHVSLQDCCLVKTAEDADSAAYRLEYLYYMWARSCCRALPSPSCGGVF